MKKIMRLTLLFSLSSMLFSCASSPTPAYITKNVDYTYKVTSMDDNITAFCFPVDNEILINYSNAKKDYIVYSGYDECSSCIKFMPILKSYIANYKYEVLYYNTISNKYSDLHNALPNVYDFSGTPNVSIYQKGAFLVSIPSSRLFNYASFESSINSYIKPTIISSSRLGKTLINSLQDHQESLVYFYDSKNYASLLTYSDEIFEKAKMSEKRLFLVDLRYVSGEDLTNLINEFTTDLLTPGAIIKIAEDASKSSSIPSSDTYLTDLKNIVDDYYQ